MEFSFREILINGIDDMVFVVKVEDQNFRYEFLNKSAMQCLRLNKDILGLTFRDVLPKEEAEFLYKKYQEVLIKREILTYEDSYRKKENVGEMNYSQVKLTPIFDGSGSCIRIVSVVRDITKEKAALSYVKEMVERIAESDERYQSLFTHNPDAILTFDKKGFITNGNEAVKSITGFEIIELIGKSFIDIIFEDINLLQQTINEALKGSTSSGEFLLKDKKGNILTINLKVIPLILENEVIGLFGIFKDITEATKNIEKLEESEKRFRIIAENAHDLITLVNKNGEITYVSPSYKNILGYHHKEYIGKHFIHNVHSDDLGRYMEIVEKSIQSDEPFTIEFRQKNANDEMLWCESIGKPVFNQKNKFQHLVVLTRDITLRKEYESKLKHFAYHDSLTGLPNRLLFKERFEIAKEQFLKNNNGLALMILDIDHFKRINDTYGHDIGDLVIKEFGLRIKESIGDHGTVARLGGDEFVILLSSIQNVENALEIAERIKSKVHKPWEVNGESLNVTTSIGIAMAPYSEGLTKSELMKKADIALYQAKDSGRDSYKLYEV
ncbi:sensor domain-containing diguanylate cyclase [Lysinibacillus antri]|uniref:Sensor domain-containing diguanylate cyclase n=1 Tax=Lysinibacillus antri TaxID=2498145 RepID=A0A3S0R4N7_9BACI|nr:sensor domain-containing diguanylate cyclase [Lysinibacillus antri]RUL48627.1 sensor domain-containing diguanylate cyclase [Lysinibacillus antri]